MGETATGERTERRRRGLRLLASAALCAGLVMPAPAAPLAAVPGAPPSADLASADPGSSERSRGLEAERRKTAIDLANLADQIQLTEDSIRALDTEIGALASDREGIRGAMIEAAARQKQAAVEIAATEARIAGLGDEEAGIRSSLRERRGLLAEVLGALERMGRKPPPALLVKPEDALGSVRSAILLGAVVPGIRHETEKLIADLDRLSRIRGDIVAEKERFVAGLTRQKAEEARLARLFAEKQKLEADHRGRREAESRRVAELGAKATSLQDLIETLEDEAKAARQAEEAEARAAAERREAALKAAAAEAERLRLAEAARKAEAARIAAVAPPAPPAAPSAEAPQVAAAPPPVGPPPAALPDAAQVAAVAVPPPATPPEPSYDVASLRRDMIRLEPGAPFSTMKGRLSKPVAGAERVGYGQGDGIGRPSTGVTFDARPGDLVTAPADGQVLYSGPFRSYGKLLILDAGDGYLVVLAGMSEIDVSVGQFVLSGEPVAVMGAQRVASAARADFGPAEPSLYVEFRKDRKPVDPTPWWTVGPSGRTRNDS